MTAQSEIKFGLPQRPYCVPRRRSSESSSDSDFAEPAAPDSMSTHFPLGSPVSHQEEDMSSPSLRRQRSRGFEDGLPPNGYVASQVTIINNLNAPGASNTNIFNSPSPETKRRSVQRWAEEAGVGSSLTTIEEEDEEAEERGRRSRKVSTPGHRSKTTHPRGILKTPTPKNDRDTLPSQTVKPNTSTTLSRHAPGARMVHIPAAAKYATTDGFGQPVTPFAVPQHPVSAAEMAGFGMPHRHGFTENKVFEKNTIEGIDASTVTAAPFYRGHRRNKTTVSSIDEFAPRAVPHAEPHKGAANNTEVFRAVGGQFFAPPTTPHFDFGAGFAEPEQAVLFGRPAFDSDDQFVPYTPTPATNFIGHPRMEVSSVSSSPSLPGSPPVLGDSPSLIKEDHRGFPKIVERTSSDSIDSTSTVTAEKWNAFEEARSLESIPDSPATFEDGSDQETPSPKPGEESPSPSGRRLRRVGAFNFGSKVDPSDTPRSVALAEYPLENVRYGDPADGVAVFDFCFASGAWPRQGLRRVRFKSNPSFASAPSVHRGPLSESSNESGMIEVEMGIDDSDAEAPRGTLRIVNGSDSNEDDEIMQLPPNLWAINMGDALTVVSTDASQRVAREEEIKVRRQPIETLSEDDEGSDLEPFDDSNGRVDNNEQIPVVKKHKRGGSLGLLRRALDTVDKYAAARAGVVVVEPVVSTPAAPTPVDRREFPTNTGVMNTGFQFPAVAPPEQQQQVARPANTGMLETGFQFPAAPPEGQRVSSMSELSVSAREIGQVKKHKTSGSFGKLLLDFSKHKDERNVLRKSKPTEKKDKQSLHRHLSEHIDGSFLPGSWKSVWAGDFQKEQLYFTGG